MKQRIQIILIVAIFVAGVRLAYILYERHEERIEDAKKAAAAAAPVNPDYLVFPKKLRPYDLKSAGDLTKQPVWVKVGYSITYFPYNTAAHHADFGHEAGLLLPIERLEIKSVVTDVFPKDPGEKQVMAVFVMDGKTYAFSVGVMKGDDFHIYSDDMLFIEDPHELYKHWPADIWQAVDQHEVKPGMSELQANFALGMGVPDSGGSTIEKTVRYPDGGKPMVVVFHDGKAVEIHPDAAASK